MNELLEKYLNYVCSKCLRSLDECDCKYNSETLICIDRNLQKQIRILNSKKYQTQYCCEGHYNEIGDLYIIFLCEYGIGESIPIPEGFKYNKNQRTLRYSYGKKLTEEQFEKAKQKQLEILLNWCNELPIFNP